MSLRFFLIWIGVVCTILGTYLWCGAWYGTGALAAVGLGLIVGGCWKRRIIHTILGSGMVAAAMVVSVAVVLMEIMGLLPSRHTPHVLERMARISEQEVIDKDCRSHFFFSNEDVWLMRCTPAKFRIIKQEFELDPVEDSKLQGDIRLRIQAKFDLPTDAERGVQFLSTPYFPIRGMSGPDGENIAVVYFETLSLLYVWNKSIF